MKQESISRKRREREEPIRKAKRCTIHGKGIKRGSSTRSCKRKGDCSKTGKGGEPLFPDSERGRATQCLLEDRYGEVRAPRHVGKKREGEFKSDFLKKRKEVIRGERRGRQVILWKELGEKESLHL